MKTNMKCDRCDTLIKPVMGIPEMHGDNVLNVNLSGDYSQFIDNDLNDPEPHTRIQLCHKCGHDFMTVFMGIPATEYTHWHPASGDDYCEGWRHA